MIRAGEYRYVSPVFAHHKSTGRITAIHHVALTNTPALPDIPAVARRRFDEEETMPLEKLLALLGLGEDADERAAEEALAALKADAAKEALAAVAKAAGLPEDADGTAVAEGVAALRAKPADAGQDPDPNKWAPRAEFDAVARRLAALETSTSEAKAQAAVDAAVEAGKVTPASCDWALAYATQDPDGFARFAAATPTLLAGGEIAPGPAPDGKAQPTVAELAICRMVGVSAEAYRKEMEQEEAA